MEINTLVTSKVSPGLGIGCTSKVLKHSAYVNFGLYDNIKCKLKELEIIDVTNTRTIDFQELKNRVLRQSGENIVIHFNEVREYVGIGWITLRVVTVDDLQKYPRVI
jgi:hypothetical protein